MMRMMKNITQQVLCLKVGKENIKVTTLYEQSEEGEAAEEEDEGSFFPIVVVYSKIFYFLP